MDKYSRSKSESRQTTFDLTGTMKNTCMSATPHLTSEINDEVTETILSFSFQISFDPLHLRTLFYRFYVFYSSFSDISFINETVIWCAEFTAWFL